jgi:hypothetical protein
MLLFWELFPVEWTDANTYDLAPEAKADYMALVADSFRLNRDPVLANEYLAQWTVEEKQAAIADAVSEYESSGQTEKAQDVRDLAMALGVPEATSPAPTPTPIEPPPTGLWDRVRLPCLVFVLVLLLLVLALLAIRALLRRRPSGVTETQRYSNATPSRGAAPPPPQRVVDDAHPVMDQVPLGRFTTTYQLGEDTYDESFSIEAPTGEFLGECGMGISETLNDSEPDKVIAFEVWLFDKSDIRTVTKVLMSEHAFHEEALRARLASKGEAVMAEIDAPFFLETSGLRVQALVTELAYGAEEEAPNSYFSRLAVELAAVAKSPEAEDSAI